MIGIPIIFIHIKIYQNLTKTNLFYYQKMRFNYLFQNN